MQGQPWEVVITSPLARAQQAAEANNLVSFYQIVEGILTAQANLAQAEGADLVNFDAGIKEARRLKDVNPDLLNGDKEVAQKREVRREAAMAQMKLQQADLATKAAHQGASAEKSHAEAGAVGAGK
jgi:hypothetical protein